MEFCADNKKWLDSGLEPQLILGDEAKVGKFFPEKGDLDDMKWTFAAKGIIIRFMYRCPFIMFEGCPVFYTSQSLPLRPFAEPNAPTTTQIVNGVPTLVYTQAEQFKESCRLRDKGATEARASIFELKVDYAVPLGGAKPKFPFDWLDLASVLWLLWEQYSDEPENAPVTLN